MSRFQLAALIAGIALILFILGGATLLLVFSPDVAHHYGDPRAIVVPSR